MLPVLRTHRYIDLGFRSPIIISVKPPNAQQPRADLEQAFSLIQGPKQLGLHVIYLEAGHR
ncbi:MAG: L-rhamnose isomerase [Sodalis sp.]|nr:MAG: L-rhamnose isomerase [Sodalis sp.]